MSSVGTPDDIPKPRAETGVDEADERVQLITWLRNELKRRSVGASRLMGLMDQNQSLSASCGEFTTGLQTVGLTLDSKDFNRLFHAVDVGGDRSVTVKELQVQLYGDKPPARMARRKSTPGTMAQNGTCKRCKKENLDLTHSSWPKDNPLRTEQRRHFGLCAKCYAEETGAKGQARRNSLRHPNAGEKRSKPDNFPLPRAETGASVDVEREQLLGWLQAELKQKRVGATRLMGLMDDNRSLSASFNEFTKGLQMVDINNLEREDFTRLFKAVDEGGDRSVSTKELQSKLFEASYPEYDKWMLVHKEELEKKRAKDEAKAQAAAAKRRNSLEERMSKVLDEGKTEGKQGQPAPPVEQRPDEEIAELRSKLAERNREVEILQEQMSISRVKELEEQLHAKSTELVAQCEKNFQLHDASQKAKDQRAEAFKTLADARETLVQGVAGTAADVARYKHVPFQELIRLRLLKETSSVDSATKGSSADAVMKLDPGNVGVYRRFTSPPGVESPAAARRAERQKDDSSQRAMRTSPLAASGGVSDKLAHRKREMKQKYATNSPHLKRRDRKGVLSGTPDGNASHGTCKKCKTENVDLSHKSWKNGPDGKEDEIYTEVLRLFGFCNVCYGREIAEVKGAYTRRSTPADFPKKPKKRKANSVEDREALLGWLQKELRRRRVGSSRLMGYMDDNRSASVSFNEFSSGLAAVDIDLEREDYMRLFKAVDVGGDRSVTLKELVVKLYEAKYGSEKERAAVEQEMKDARPSTADVQSLAVSEDMKVDLSASTSSLPALKDGRRPDGSLAADWEVQQMAAVEQEIKDLKSRNRQLVSVLEAERRSTDSKLEALKDVGTIQSKHTQSVARLRNEKAAVRRLQDELGDADERIDALSEHIEKLMVHLKHEAAAKAKASDNLRRVQHELQLERDRNAVLTKKNRARDDVIRQLREGCKILEDQLRLMDQKYVDLRAKLDWTRNNAQKEVKRIQNEANRLRAKWMMAAGTEATLSALGIEGQDEVGGRQLMSTAGPASGGSKKAFPSKGALPDRTSFPGQAGGMAMQRPPSTAGSGFRPGTGNAQSIAPHQQLQPLDSTDEPWSDNKLESLHNWASTDQRR